jgi:anti-sigma factor RsiW
VECEEVIGKLDAYLENRLNDIETHRLEKHLERCIECQKEYEQLKEIFDILSGHPTILPPEDFTVKVMNAIQPTIKQNRISPMIMKKWGISFVAAGLLVFVLNTSLGYNIQDISSSMYKEPFSVKSQISNYVKKIPKGFINNYKKLEIKLFENNK